MKVVVVGSAGSGVSSIVRRLTSGGSGSPPPGPGPSQGYEFVRLELSAKSNGRDGAAGRGAGRGAGRSAGRGAGRGAGGAGARGQVGITLVDVSSSMLSAPPSHHALLASGTAAAIFVLDASR